MTTSVIDWLELIWKTELPSNSKYVASYLRTYMNMKRDICWPSIGRISVETGLSEQTVRSHIKRLESESWLEVVRTDGGHSGTTNRYKACVPDTPLAVAPLQPLDPTPATVAPLPLQPLGGNKQLNKQPNKQIKQSPKLEERISDSNAEKAMKYWNSKRMLFDVNDEWLRFTAYHESRNTKVTNFDAAWRTWYCNAVKYRGDAIKSDKADAMSRLTDKSWADGIL